jgi:citrate synthase
MANGLDDVIAAETELSHVDGEAGRLILRGHDMETLAGRRSYEEVTALLWDGLVAADDVARHIAEGRVAAFELTTALAPLASGLTPIEAMRFCLARIGDTDRLARPAELVGAVGAAAAAAIRIARGEALIAPDPRLSHAEDILRMIGTAPSATEVTALDTYLVTTMDHGLNASTFTARVVASTAAGLPSAIVAALSALKGPLHGGAPGPVLDMLDAIGSPENAEAWLEAALDRGERLMGFGHRIYRVRDPRADILAAAVRRLGGSGRIPLAEAVERAALTVLARRKRARPLDVNVEFHTALLLEALRVPRDGFTPLFAAGRAAGWVAHVAEQVRGGRIIRPKSRYVGPMPLEACA